MTGYKNMTRQENFPRYGRPGIKRVEIHVEIQDMENLQGMKNSLDMELKIIHYYIVQPLVE